MADEIGILTDVVPVPGGREGQDQTSSHLKAVDVCVLLLVDGRQLLRKAFVLGGQIGDHLCCDGRCTDPVLVQHRGTTHVTCTHTHLSAASCCKLDVQRYQTFDD